MADLTEANRAHFNKSASSYAASSKIIEEIQARKSWIGVDWLTDAELDDDEDDETDMTAPSGCCSGACGGHGAGRRSVRLLDYACGTGMVSRALGAYVTATVGIDLSSNMVDQYNTHASNQGLSPIEMSAVVGNLLDASDPAPAALEAKRFYDFDIAVVGLGFHHFEDPLFAARQLAGRLRVGGTLMLVDFVTHGDHFGHVHENGHGAHGHDHSHEVPAVSHQHSHAHSHSHEPTNSHSHKQSSEGEHKGKTKAQDETEAVRNTVKHLGFAEEDIKSYFEQAGCGKDFRYDVLEKDITFKMTNRTMVRKIFFCRGTKTV